MLNGLHAAGIEALALQLIAHSPVAVQAELLNTNRQAQEQAHGLAGPGRPAGIGCCSGFNGWA